MSTITKEWLQQKIAEMEAARDEIPFGLDHDDSNTLAALCIALASLEEEPVAYMHRSGQVVTREECCDDKTFAICCKVETPLYTAPPAPVSMKDHQIRELVNELRDIAVEYHGTQQLRERIARTIREAMLQGAYGNSPAQSDCCPAQNGNSPVIPDGWVLVPKEPTEHMIVEGFESEPDEFFSDEEVWEAYDAMSGCQQAAHRAKLCWAAMIKAAPKLE
ncbi:hypothetical protein [Citrobacter freundii]|uniref:hypothetical protein n=1 Tax=Citrobacter freundii TaxID=546 RepID=UPI003D6F5648